MGQERDSGADIDVDIPWTVECKRTKEPRITALWMTQAERAAVATGHPPLVVTRADNGRSYALLRFDDFLKLLAEARVGQALGELL